MSIEHRAFPKIERAGTITAGGEWVATEKIHGAQLVVATDGREVAIGKRRAWLAAHDAFFGWQLLRPHLDQGVRAMQARLPRRSTLWLYGELFGGGYPHPDIAPVPGLVPVQTGVWYGPSLYFAAFDGLIARDGDEDYFLGWDDLSRLALDAGMETVPLIARGSRAALSSTPVRFETRVPASFGLPPIAHNYAEGYVLKVAGRSGPSGRPVVKRKIPEFDEDRFDESRALDPHRYLTYDELARLAWTMVNVPRIASARSKVGLARAAVIEEVTLDVLIDLVLMLPRRLEVLSDDEAAALEASIRIRTEELLPEAG